MDFNDIILVKSLPPRVAKLYPNPLSRDVVEYLLSKSPDIDRVSGRFIDDRFIIENGRELSRLHSSTAKGLLIGFWAMAGIEAWLISINPFYIFSIPAVLIVYHLIIKPICLSIFVYSNERSRKFILWMAEVQKEYSESRGYLLNCGWRELETIGCLTLKAQGYTARVVGGVADGGIDVDGWRGSERVIMQCKQWRKRIGRAVVYEFITTADELKMDVKMIILAPGGFAPGARVIAAKYNIELWGVDDVIKILTKAGQQIPNVEANYAQATLNPCQMDLNLTSTP